MTPLFKKVTCLLGLRDTEDLTDASSKPVSADLWVANGLVNLDQTLCDNSLGDIHNTNPNKSNPFDPALSAEQSEREMVRRAFSKSFTAHDFADPVVHRAQIERALEINMVWSPVTDSAVTFDRVVEILEGMTPEERSAFLPQYTLSEIDAQYVRDIGIGLN